MNFNELEIGTIFSHHDIRYVKYDENTATNLRTLSRYIFKDQQVQPENMNNQITLTTTKERLKSAADQCPTVKQALEKLFPEHFVKESLNPTPAINVKFETCTIPGSWTLRNSDRVLLFDNSIPHESGNRIKLHGKSKKRHYKFRIEEDYLIIEEK